MLFEEELVVAEEYTSGGNYLLEDMFLKNTKMEPLLDPLAKMKRAASKMEERRYERLPIGMIVNNDIEALKR